MTRTRKQLGRDVCATRGARVRNSRGFTLLEVLISIGILAAMAGTIAEAMNGVITARDRSQKNAALVHEINVGLSKMYDDLNMAFTADTTFQGKDGYYLTGFIGDGESMSFSTMSHVHYVKNARDSDQVSVGYFPKNNSRGTSDLMRRESDHLMEKIDEGGYSFVLVPDIKQVEFSYYDSNEKAWKNDWDTDSVEFAGRLPYMVKIAMTVYGNFTDADERERREHKFEVTVPVVMYAQKISF